MTTVALLPVAAVSALTILSFRNSAIALLQQLDEAAFGGGCGDRSLIAI